MEYEWTAADFETLTIGTAAVVIFDTTRINPTTGLIPIDAAELQVTFGTVRYRYDGGTPTSSSGHLWEYSNTRAPIKIVGQPNLRQFKAIGVAAGSALMTVTYLRR